MYSEIRELNEVIASLLSLLKIEPKGALKTLMSNIDKFQREPSHRQLSRIMLQDMHSLNMMETDRFFEENLTEGSPEPDLSFTKSPLREGDLFSSCKWVACKILIKILEIQNECRSNLILFKFKNITHISLASKKKGAEVISKKSYEKLLLGDGSEVSDSQLVANLFNAYQAGIRDHCFIELFSGKEISSILLNLTLQPDLKLKTEALRLLYYLHSPIEITRRNIETAIILDSANTKMSYPDCHNLSRALIRLAETTDKWYLNFELAAFSAFENILSIIEEHLVQKQVKRVPGMTTPVSEDDRSISASDIPPLEQHLWRNVRSVINPYYQNIFRHLEVFSSLIKILEADLLLVASKSTPKLKVEVVSQARTSEVIRRIFIVFWNACIDNQQNKSQIGRCLNTVVMKYFENDSYNLSVLLFLLEFAKDNENLVDAEEDPLWIGALIHKLCRLPNSDQRKILILSTLGQLTRYHGTINMKNQNFICDQVLKGKNRNGLIDFSNSTTLETIERLTQIQPPEFKVNDQELISQDGTLGYATSVIWFLRRISQERNSHTEGMTQILLPLRAIGELFKTCPADYSFSLQLLTFFYSVHLYATRRLPPQTDDILVNIAHVLTYMLKNFVNIEYMTMKDCYRVSGTFIQRNDVFMLDFYGRIIECVYAIMSHAKSLSNIAKDSQEEQMIRDLLEGCFGYYNIAKSDAHRISTLQLITYLMQRTPDYIAFDSKSKFKDEFRELYTAIIRKGGLVQNAVTHKKHTARLIKRGGSTKRFYQNSSKTMTQTSLKHKQSILQRIHGPVPAEAVFVEHLRASRDSFFSSKQFREIAEIEFQGLIETINGVDTKDRNTKSRHAQFQDVKTVSGFFKSMVQFLIWETSKIPQELILIIVQIFTDFLQGIRAQNQQEEWKSRKLLNYRQIILIKLDTMDLIYQLISKNISLDITAATVRLGIAVLEGGNKLGQMKFLDSMKKDKSNTAFRVLFDIIEDSYELLENHLTAKQEVMVEGILQDGDFGIGVSPSMMNPAIVTANFERNENSEAFQNARSSIKNIKTILRYLQLLCEGHNIELQNAIRDQKWSASPSMNRDFVEIGSRMLASFAKFNDRLSYELGMQLLNFLIEIIQGPCPENQAALIKYKIIDSSKDLINDIGTKKEFKMIWGKDSEEEMDRLGNLVSKTRCLLASLLEGDQDKGRTLLVAENLNIEFLAEMLLSELKSFIGRKNPANTHNLERFMSTYQSFADRNFFDEEIIEAFQTFFFLQLILDETKAHQKYLSKLGRETALALEFFRENSRSVEIVFKSNLLRVDFPVHPACRHLPEALKQEFFKKYNRESPNEKMVQFMRATPRFIDRMDYNINMKTKRLSITTRSFRRARDISLLLTLLINVAHFIFSDTRIEQNQTEISLGIPWSKQFIQAAGILHLLSTSLMAVIWFYVYGPLVHMDSWLLKIKEIRAKVFTAEDESEERELCKVILQKNVVDQTFTEKQKLLSYGQAQPGSSKASVTSHISLLGYIFFDILRNANFRYFLFFVLFSALGLAYEMPIFYSLQLFDIIDKFDDLKNVIKAFTYHKKQIITTLVLAIIIVYNYSLFAYYYLNETFYNYSVGDIGENLCVGVWHCFTTVFSLVSSPDAGASLFGQRGRHARPPVLQQREPRKIRRALLLRRDGLPRGERLLHEHDIGHHHRHLRRAARREELDRGEQAERLLRLLDQPQHGSLRSGSWTRKATASKCTPRTATTSGATSSTSTTSG